MNGYYIREALAAVGVVLVLGIVACSCLYWYAMGGC